MLSLYEFNELSEPEKQAVLWDGTYIADRVEGELIVQLYRLNNFYIEIFYEQQQNRIEKFNAFNSNARLALYFPRVNTRLV